MGGEARLGIFFSLVWAVEIIILGRVGTEGCSEQEQVS
jgi:hypothetical protein